MINNQCPQKRDNPMLRFTQKLRFDCGDGLRLRERHVPLERTRSNVVAGGSDV
jgi:hypothetical protein